MDENFWRNATKIYCDNANMAVASGTGDVFLLALLSGGNAQVYTFTPEHMKRVLQFMTYNVNKYEQQNGPIKTEDWTPEMKSPIQIKDLRKE